VSPFVLLRANAPMELGLAHFRFWHFSDISGPAHDVRSWG